jgi:hypothetical protein
MIEIVGRGRPLLRPDVRVDSVPPHCKRNNPANEVLLPMLGILELLNRAYGHGWAGNNEAYA